MHVVAVADLNVERARSQLHSPAGRRSNCGRLDRGCAKDGATHITADADGLDHAPGIEVIIEATGYPAGIRFA